VTAVAGKLSVPVAIGDHVDVMAEDAAQISDLLIEDRVGAVRIVACLKQKRMTALHADVFVMSIPFGQLRVCMVAKKTRERMPDVRERAVLAQVRRSASALPPGPSLVAEPMVIDLMAPDSAPKLRHEYLQRKKAPDPFSLYAQKLAEGAHLG
jgi:hypothetical protein